MECRVVLYKIERLFGLLKTQRHAQEVDIEGDISMIKFMEGHIESLTKIKAYHNSVKKSAVTSRPHSKRPGSFDRRINTYLTSADAKELSVLSRRKSVRRDPVEKSIRDSPVVHNMMEISPMLNQNCNKVQPPNMAVGKDLMSAPPKCPLSARKMCVSSQTKPTNDTLPDTSIERFLQLNKVFRHSKKDNTIISRTNSVGQQESKALSTRVSTDQKKLGLTLEDANTISKFNISENNSQPNTSGKRRSSIYKNPLEVPKLPKIRKEIGNWSSSATNIYSAKLFDKLNELVTPEIDSTSHITPSPQLSSAHQSPPTSSISSSNLSKPPFTFRKIIGRSIDTADPQVNRTYLDILACVSEKTEDPISQSKREEQDNENQPQESQVEAMKIELFDSFIRSPKMQLTPAFK